MAALARHTGASAMTGLRSALWLPPFDDLADPTLVARLAAEAEGQAGTGSSSGTT